MSFCSESPWEGGLLQRPSVGGKDGAGPNLALGELSAERGEGLVGAGFSLLSLKIKMAKSSVPRWSESKACDKGESGSKANAAGHARPTSLSQRHHNPTRTERGCDIVPVSPRGPGQIQGT